MLIKKSPLDKDDLCLFFNESMVKIIQNIEARNGRLKAFDLSFNFEKSRFTLTEKDIRAYRTRYKD
ncbi:hypothetical protein Sgly_0472 [Syntrophobotulus glycolicus DSM 8271]|uniref:Uncharacterized protein n=1 Tax=Syntrophobotulus glycolicus (strain DSM 8271 / FlGlyR) TaxID=645991 RepID=F0SYN6_SYNGF|nr:hypothetical protein [Syntrophobotulus glycolicus]ADY54837.1 hypothetical protein Sgly_0472 [Syntrophobotulus glycolicus DSM 8271]